MKNLRLVCCIAHGHKRIGDARATMKCDEYGFTLYKFDRLIPYSTNSFAFPFHVHQVFLWMMGGMMDEELFCGGGREDVESCQGWMEDQICKQCK